MLEPLPPPIPPPLPALAALLPGPLLLPSGPPAPDADTVELGPSADGEFMLLPLELDL